ncbi:hypothetical protein K490DRAFT_65311 [Saccharata proteae CBS 121410]|uniref:Exoribonuclease phosphorolytic domain-containing protein n=1 Tax=Saccharata proteae CBS 121410 TaxID=1314787 RepID=A0A9P4HX18_9PEZI|nr:hypothetical protein K490DRAFT_65311 [Saccharata proteae CBS 121410]
MPTPQVSLADLHRADGSATYEHNGYSVICAVNGPIEVGRRDELPEEAAIEVNVRPASGVGSPKERELEATIHSTLRHCILVRQFPRTLVQVTLQVLSLPEGDVAGDRSSASTLSILPSLLNASMLALLSASIPLSTTFAATILAVTPENRIIQSPSVKVLAQASSAHVFAFTASGELLVAQSEGAFEMEVWEKAHDAAKIICAVEMDDGMEVDDAQEEWLHGVWKEAVKRKVDREQRWREAV